MDGGRAAGHEDAAELLSKLPTPAAEVEAEPEAVAAEQEAPSQQTLTLAEADEAQRHAEGRALLDAMQRQLGRQWATVPKEGPTDGR